MTSPLNPDDYLNIKDMDPFPFEELHDLLLSYPSISVHDDECDCECECKCDYNIAPHDEGMEDEEDDELNIATYYDTEAFKRFLDDAQENDADDDRIESLFDTMMKECEARWFAECSLEKKNQ